MRLREIQKILLKVELSNYRLSYVRRNSADYLENLINFKDFLSIIKDISSYAVSVEYLMQSPIYATTSDTLFINNEAERKLIVSHAYYLANSAEALLRTSENLLDDLNDETISIKMRETRDLESLISDMTTLKTCISQLIVHPNINGKLEVSSWEAGSMWLNLFLGSALGVGIVAAAAWSAAVVNKKVQEGKILAEMVRGLAIKNDSLEEINIKQQEAISALISEEAKRIQVKYHGEDEDNENFGRIKYSIKMLSELIAHGTEVHPSLTAPESVSNLFPDFAQLGSIASTLKLISSDQRVSANGISAPAP